MYKLFTCNFLFIKLSYHPKSSTFSTKISKNIVFNIHNYISTIINKLSTNNNWIAYKKHVFLIK